MKLSLVKLRLPVEHPALGGASASVDLFSVEANGRVPAAVIERIDSNTVAVTINGVERLYNWSQVIHADRLVQAQPGLQKAGKR